MSDESRLDPRRAPKQARSKETCDAILVAARLLLARGGVDDLTTSAIAARAGVSVGSLYQFFPGKDAILARLVRDMRADMMSDLRSADDLTRHKDLRLAMTGLIDASLRHHMRDPALTRALEQIEAALPMDAESQQLKQEMFDLVSEVLIRHEVLHPEQTARDLIGMVHGVVQAALHAGESDFDDLSVRLQRAVCGYLGV